MNKQLIIKKVGIAFVTLGLVAILFSSCHRSYGCPGKITHDTEVQAQPELDC